MSDFRERLDALLGHITMYKLVAIGLMAIIAMAFPLMLTGYLSYSPVSFLISIVVILGAGIGSNVLFGHLFGVKSHLDSALITSLILILLFSPPETFGMGVKLGLIAVIAMASKYILNIHGKHVFNPAAIAIVIASISGLAYASWWVATPALLPVTAIVALLVLYKTQKMTIAGVFLAAAISMIFIQTLLHGNASMQTLTLALTSWPLVFFAGIMLTEPLTLPPTRKQQIMLAIVVGVLMTLPLHYSVLSMTPALALVIGNALAFYVGIRRSVMLRFVSKKKDGRDAYEFTFDTPKFAFYPGQYIEVSLPHDKPDFRGSRRIFTMIGRPNDEQVSIATRFPAKRSTFKNQLMELKPGQKLWGLRVAGDFIMPEDEHIPLVCVAGGIGITPFVSFAMNAGNRDITILYSVNSVEDITFAKELDQYNVKVVVVTQDDSKLPSDDWQRENGIVDANLLKKYVTHHSHLYISGPPAMVHAVKRTALGLDLKNIHTDQFSGY